MLFKKYLTISILLIASLIIFSGCGKSIPNEIPALSSPGAGVDEESVTVYVLTRYELTEVTVAYQNYNSWLELLDGEFDGREAARAEVCWRGDYIVAVGNLRPGKPSGIAVYLNGVYSNYFVKNCDYESGFTLTFIEPGANIAQLN